MQYNPLGDTGLSVSELGFGTWAIGGDWGKNNDEESLKGLQKAMDAGVNFFDTADVYGSGHSEELLAKATKGKEDSIHIATKFIRLGDINDPANYSEDQIRTYVENSLRRLQRETIDLYQIHCAPLDMLKNTDIFPILEKLKKEGKIRSYGVSVESDEEGLFVLENTNASALQVIFNVLRQKPLKELFPKAQEKGVGILARVPLASGLLTGKFSKDHQFESDDHRNFNKDGGAFNVGETFGGIPFEKGVELSREVSWIGDERDSITRAALKWVMQQEAVTSVIPGFKNVKQVEDNLKSLEVKNFSAEELKKLETFYWENVHAHIRGPY
ncbi:aldo/keto reductase [Alkalibacterium iburiense]|uniref:Aldo/keto reductase n=1 Tax=Alkalibacterium iburiense TaxID=290589 RepID=A0ABN0XQL8_9LACT